MGSCPRVGGFLLSEGTPCCDIASGAFHKAYCARSHIGTSLTALQLPVEALFGKYKLTARCTSTHVVIFPVLLLICCTFLTRSLTHTMDTWQIKTRVDVAEQLAAHLIDVWGSLVPLHITRNFLLLKSFLLQFGSFLLEYRIRTKREKRTSAKGGWPQRRKKGRRRRGRKKEDVREVGERGDVGEVEKKRRRSRGRKKGRRSRGRKGEIRARQKRGHTRRVRGNEP